MVPVQTRAEVVLLCDGAEAASWPLLSGDPPGLSIVDELACVQLEARRQGCSIWLRHACPHLVDLLELVGLADMIRVGGHPPLPDDP